MAGDNLTLSIGADTSKLRGELKLLQLEMQNVGKAAKAAVNKGDTAEAARLSAQFGTMADRAAKLTTEIKGTTQAFGGLDTAGTKALSGIAAGFQRVSAAAKPVGEHFSLLHQRAQAFGASLNNMAGSIIPHWKEVLALGTVGGAAGFLSLVEATANWGHQLKENADQLGMTIAQVGGISRAAKQAGLDVDKLVAGLSKFNIALQDAADTRDKALGDLVTTLAGAEKLASTAVFRGGPPGANTARMITMPTPGEIAKVGGQLETEFKRLQVLFPDVAKRWRSPEAFRQFVLNARNAGEDARKVIDEELSKLGIDFKPDTIGEAIKRGTKGFRDIFADLGIDVFDKATGQIRNTGEALGDFLDKFKTLSITEQTQLTRKTFGRGFAEFIPIMQKGRDGLLQFTEALKAAGVDTSPFEKEVEEADNLYKTLRRLDSAVSSMRRSFVLPFAPVFEPLANAMQQQLASIKPQLAELGQSIADTLIPIVQDIGALLKGERPMTPFVQDVIAGIKYIKDAFNGFMGFMNGVATFLNATFNTDFFSGRGLLIGAALASMTGAFNTLFQAASLFVAIFAAGGPWGALILAIGAAAVAAWTFRDSISSWMQLNLPEWLNSLIGLLVQFGKLEFTGIQIALKAVSDTIQFLVNQARDAISFMGRLLGMAGQAPGGLPAGFAAGGMVRGAGSGISDSILARLSNGEFVVRAAAVNHWGPQFLSAINAMRDPLAGFAAGGLVGRGFADGGLVAGGAGGRPVHLHLGNHSFPLSGESSVVDALVGEANRQHTRSAGVKPSWYGSRSGGR